MGMWIRNGLIVAWLAIQLLLPLRGFLEDKYESRGHFSWNMYATRYRCRVHYYTVTPQGEESDMDYDRYFHNADKASMVLHRDALPRFHAWLCEQARHEGRVGSLRGSVSCRLNDDPPIPLADPGTDLCTAPNYGVVPR